MTLAEVNLHVEAIRKCAGDEEIAHTLEDRLHRAVLEAIAAGAPNAADLAAAALVSTGIDFARWCA